MKTDPIQKMEGFASQKLIVIPPAFLEEHGEHPLILPLYATDIGYFPKARYHNRTRPEGCGAYIVMLCEEGSGWYRIGSGKVQSVERGQLFILPPDTGHAYGASAENPWSIFWVHVMGSEAPAFFGAADSGGNPVPVGYEKAVKLAGLFNECTDILLKGITADHMVYVSQTLRHLLGVACFLHGGLQPGSERGQMIEESVQLMNDRVGSTLTLKELSEAARLSVPHYVQLFKTRTGYTPIDFYLKLKIQRACQYLDMTDLTLKQIAGQVGFSDPYYFSRMFRKIVGMAPSDYRKTKKG